MTTRKTRPLVAAVLSGKGGVGKTTIALLVAAHAARQRKRAVVLDLDFPGTEISVYANDPDKKSLPSLLEILTLSDHKNAKRNTFESYEEWLRARLSKMIKNRGGFEAYLHRVMVNSPGPPVAFYVWPSLNQAGGSNPPLETRLPEVLANPYGTGIVEYRIAKLLEFLASEGVGFDVLILDLPPFFTGLSGQMWRLLDRKSSWPSSSKWGKARILVVGADVRELLSVSGQLAGVKPTAPMEGGVFVLPNLLAGDFGTQFSLEYAAPNGCLTFARACVRTLGRFGQSESIQTTAYAWAQAISSSQYVPFVSQLDSLRTTQSVAVLKETVENPAERMSSGLAAALNAMGPVGTHPNPIADILDAARRG